MTNFGNKSSQIPTLPLTSGKRRSVGGAPGMHAPRPHQGTLTSPPQLQLAGTSAVPVPPGNAHTQGQCSHTGVLLSQSEWT